MNGTGDLDRCTVAMDLGVSQEIEGRGLLERNKPSLICTSKKLITTAIGSGPLYDITIDGSIEEEHKDFFDDRPVEAVIEYERTQDPELNRALLGGEQFVFSPSLYEPNYDKVDIRISSDLLFSDRNGTGTSHADGDFSRVLKTKISGDGSTLAVLIDRDDRFSYFGNIVRATVLVIYKKNGEQWNQHGSPIVVDETSISETRNTDFDAQNEYLISNLAINYNGDTVAVSHKDSGGGVSANEIDSQRFGQVQLYKLGFNSEDSYDIAARIKGVSDTHLGVDLSLNDDGTILAVSERTWSSFPNFQGAVRVLKFNNTVSEPADFIQDFNFEQLGNTLVNSVFREYFRINAFGQKIAINGNGDRLAVLVITPPAGFGGRESESCLATIDVYDYNAESLSWELVQKLHSDTGGTGDPNNMFKFDPKEDDYGQFGVGGAGTRQGDSLSGFDLAISQDGDTVAFGAIDPYPDSFNDAYGGAVLTWRKTGDGSSGQIWSLLGDIIRPDYTRQFNDREFIGPVGLGGNLSLSSDGNKLMVSQFKSVSVYEYSSDGPSIGNGGANIIIGDNDIASSFFPEDNFDSFIIGSTPENRGRFGFDKTSYNVNEGAGSVELTIVREEGSKGKVSVSYETVSDTAIAGEDFVAKKSIVNFAEGETQKKINIKIIDDSEIEGQHQFSVQITNVSVLQEEPTYFVVGSVDENLAAWVKVCQIDTFACPPSTFNDKIEKPADSNFPITDASMSQDGLYVSILKNNYVNKNDDSFKPDQSSQQAVYKIDYSKDLCQFDRDLVGNYIDWKTGVVSCKDKKFQSRFDIDEDSLKGFRSIEMPYALYEDQPFGVSEPLGEYLFVSDANIEYSNEMSISFFVNVPVPTKEYSWPNNSI